MADDIIERAKAVLKGVTEGPWEHRIAPPDESSSEFFARALRAEGESLHVLIAESPTPQFAYVVPAITGDGPTSATNAEFIAASRTLVPELIMEIEILRGRVRDAFNAGWDARGYSEGLQ